MASFVHAVIPARLTSAFVARYFFFLFLNAVSAAGPGIYIITTSPLLLQLMPYLGTAPGTMPGR